MASGCMLAVASTLLAGMELAREGELAVDQEEAIWPASLRRGYTQGLSLNEG